MATLEQKVKISLGSAGLFFLLNSPNSYKFVSNILNTKLFENNCPNHLGIFINTILFFGFTYISMGDPFKDSFFKLKNTTYGSLIYFLISSPTIYHISNKLLNFDDCRNTVSLLVHSAIYFLILVGVMYFPE